MAIRKRKSVPKDEASTASQHDEDESTARHPHLTGLRQDIYYFIRDNQPCTRDDVSRGTQIKSSTCTARIKELIDEGFLVEPPGVTKLNKSGVRSRVLAVSARPMGGSPLDKVRIEIKLTIDSNGTYGVTAFVVRGLPQAGTTHVIKRQRVTLTAPHPDTYKGATASELVSTVSRYEMQSHADDIIDGVAIPLED